MSKAKFTKGEWKAAIFEDGASVDVGSFEIINIENTAIDRDYGEKGFNHWSESDTVHIDIPMSEQHGNAHLIAAAPDMYKMIDDLTLELQMAINELNTHRMTKVTSQTETPPDMWDMQSCHEAQVLLKKARGEQG